MSQEAVASGRRSRCPVCGLQLQVCARGSTPVLEYDFPEWTRLCRFSAAGGPSMCLALTVKPLAAVPSTPLGSGEASLEVSRSKARL
jgi:hypothetical protein